MMTAAVLGIVAVLLPMSGVTLGLVLRLHSAVKEVQVAVKALADKDVGS